MRRDSAASGPVDYNPVRSAAEPRSAFSRPMLLMYSKLASLILALVLLPGAALGQQVVAQQAAVRGVVRDAVTEEPLPGVNVYLEAASLQGAHVKGVHVKGAHVRGTGAVVAGAATDLEGRYELTNVAPGAYRLVASFIGFKKYESDVVLAAGEVLAHDVALREDLLGLEEVVVTGQGAGIESRRLSTTVEVITPAQIAATPTTRIEDLLQARLPNAQVRFSSGQPGTATMIRSRGVTSANGSTTPVIYVDGVRVDNLNTAAALDVDTGGAQSGAVVDIPVENIERIEFVKGGAASTVYGSDAANGVIQIFTKHGVQGRSTLSFESELGWEDGTEDFLRYGRTADVLFRRGLLQGYRLSGGGGTKDFTYSFSGRMYGSEGFRVGNESRRYDLRTSLSAAINPITRYTGTFAFVDHSYGRDHNANSALGSFGNLEAAAYGPLDAYDDESFAALRDEIRAIVDALELRYDTERFQTSQALSFTPLAGLTGKLTGGVDYRVGRTNQVMSNAYWVATGYYPEGTSDQGLIERSERRSLSLTLEASLQHQARRGRFSFVTTALGQAFRVEDDQLFTLATEVVEGSGSVNDAADQSTTDFHRSVANYGVYVGENVGFADRLFVEFGGRVDGNSAFGQEVGLQFYPKLGVAYTVSDEAFFRGLVPAAVVSRLKLRGSYGAAGNYPTPFANQRTIAVNPYLGAPSLTFAQPGNDALRPEKVYTTEVGADLGLLGDRLAVELTYYDALTRDALFVAPYAPSYGQDAQLRNVGEIRNRGFEAAATAFVVSRRDLDLRLNASLNTLHNEVVSNGGTAAFDIGGFPFLGSWVGEGQPVGYLRGNRPTFDAEGNIAVDDEGNLVIEQGAVLGSPLPDLFGTLGLDLRYKRLSLMISADYQRGAQGGALDEVLRFSAERARLADDLSDGTLDGPVVQITDGRIPEATLLKAAQGVPGYNHANLAGVWIEDTDYLKVRQIALGYTLPERVLPALLRQATLRFAVTNPFNFAASTFDPETSGTSVTAQNGVNVGGFGYATESAPRQYSFTLNVGF